MARTKRLDPSTEGISPKLFLRVPQWFKDELEQVALEERREVPDYVRMVLDDALSARAKRLNRKRRRGLFDKPERLERSA